MRIVDACPHARIAGVKPDLPLADARALLPGLVVADTDPVGNAAVLNHLARWCVRYTPWAAPEVLPEMSASVANGEAYTMPGAGIWLDVTGCAHLLGGEESLLHDLLGRLRSDGYHARAAIADTPGAAWALARFGSVDEAGFLNAPPGDVMVTLAALPTAGLRLPDALLGDLNRLGLRTIGQVIAIPRESLVTRFGCALTCRLDQITGHVGEPISPLVPAPQLRSRLVFAEPIGTRADIDTALERMLEDLCIRLAESQEGIRRMELVFYRSDGSFQEIAIGTSRPARNPAHCARLFREKLDGVDPGFGIDLMILNACEVASLQERQSDLQQGKTPDARDTAPLVDSLANRLGAENVARIEPRASHLPELAQSEQALLEIRKRSRVEALNTAPRSPEALSGEHVSSVPRPVHLLPQPEPIEVMAPIPDHPPVLFRWRRQRHRVRRADGPERIGPEWWRMAANQDTRGRQLRDYYCLEDDIGGRYWVFREGLYRPDQIPQWYLHGVFG